MSRALTVLRRSSHMRKDHRYSGSCRMGIRSSVLAPIDITALYLLRAGEVVITALVSRTGHIMAKKQLGGKRAKKKIGFGSDDCVCFGASARKDGRFGGSAGKDVIEITYRQGLRSFSRRHDKSAKALLYGPAYVRILYITCGICLMCLGVVLPGSQWTARNVWLGK